MNIHLITYLTSKLFWIYTVFRYNTILYPKNEDTQKLFAYFCAYLLSCWGSMQWGTMYGDLIFELIALLIITVAYQADWQLIIPGLFEPPVRTLRATIPENESHIFR